MLEKDFHKDFIPEIVCVTAHALIGIILIPKVYYNRKYYPFQQNSPYLIIFSYLMLLITSISLLLGQIFNTESAINNPQKCKYEKEKQILICNLIYTFCLEFVLFTYMMRMLRIILCYSSNRVFLNREGQIRPNLSSIFKSELKIGILGCIWGLIIVMMDLLLKYFYWHNEPIDLKGKTFLHLYPQIDQFFCDQSQISPKKQFLQYFYKGKLLIEVILYLLLYIKTSKVNPALSFRFQYNLLLILKVDTLLARIIISIINNNSNEKISTIMIVHYIDCMTNLITALIFLFLYSQSASSSFKFVSYDNFSLNFLCQKKISLPGARKSFEKFLEKKDLKKLLEIYKQLQQIQKKKQKKKQMQEQEEQEEQEQYKNFIKELNKILQIIINSRNILQRYPQYAQLLKNNIVEGADRQNFCYISAFIKSVLTKLNQNWQQTQAFSYLYTQAQNEAIYERRMRQLNLIT